MGEGFRGFFRCDRMFFAIWDTCCDWVFLTKDAKDAKDAKGCCVILSFFLVLVSAKKLRALGDLRVTPSSKSSVYNCI